MNQKKKIYLSMFALTLWATLNVGEGVAGFDIKKFFQKKSKGHAKTLSLNQELPESKRLENFNGVLKTQDVNMIIKELIKKGEVPISSEYKDFKIINIGQEGGMFSGQIFKINGVREQGKEDDLFILKGVIKGIDELNNLAAVDQKVIIPFEKYIQKYQHNGERKHYPIITKSLINFSIDTYSPHRNRVRAKLFYSLLETAQGRSINKWISYFVDESKKGNRERLKAREKLEKIFVGLGHQMAHMHYALQEKPRGKKHYFGKTRIHGDFHGDNVYASFEESGKVQVSLIDNETFFLDKAYGVKDLLDLYVLTSYKTFAHYYTKKLSRYYKMGIRKSDWYHIWGVAFYSYAKTYTRLTQGNLEEVRKELTKIIDNLMSAKKFINLRYFFDQRYAKLMKYPSLKHFKEKRELDRCLKQRYVSSH